MNWHFHNARNPTGFVAYGTEAEAISYLKQINWGRAIDLWTLRSARGAKPRGISLTEILAEHAAAQRDSIAATTRALHHGSK